MKLNVSKCKRIVFQCYMLQWTGHFLMAQLKQSWQHYQPCVEWHFLKNSYNLTKTRRQSNHMRHMYVDAVVLITCKSFDNFLRPLEEEMYAQNLGPHET